jgi:hypothetical protein
MGAPDKEIKALFLLNNSICAFRGCDNELIVDEYDLDDGSPHIAIAAHIVGEKPGSARYDPNCPENLRNSHKNLIPLCPTCHEKIDKNPKKYPVKLLREMKRQNEEAALNQNIHNVKFSHLDVAAQAIATTIQNGKVEKSDYNLTAIDEKIKINNFNPGVRALIEQSILNIGVVDEYLSAQDKFDSKFRIKLIERFKEEYGILSREYHGTRLFYQMQRWVQEKIDFSDIDNFPEVIAAAFLILCYLFERCEVFKK